MNALIVVDIQVDFLPGGTLAVPGGNDIVPLVNSLMPRFDLVVATQDWHPEGHESFASSHPGKTVFEKIDLHGLPQVLWPNHCVQGTQGAALATSLNVGPIEAIFRKGTNKAIDSYSGFFDNGRRKQTGLAGYLRERQIKRVFVCGLAADFCVYYTALDAVKEGFATTMFEDMTRPIDVENFEKAKIDFKSNGGIVTNSNAFTL